MKTLADVVGKFLYDTSKDGGVSETLESWNGFFVEYAGGYYNIYATDGEFLFETHSFDTAMRALQIKNPRDGQE